MNLSRLLWYSLLILAQGSLGSESRKEQTLAKAKELKQNQGVITLTGPLFNDIVKAPRDFSVVVALTVLDESFDCGPCK